MENRRPIYIFTSKESSANVRRTVIPSARSEILTSIEKRTVEITMNPTAVNKKRSSPSLRLSPNTVAMTLVSTRSPEKAADITTNKMARFSNLER